MQLSNRNAAAILGTLLALACVACSAPGSTLSAGDKAASKGVFYRCEQGIEFVARLVDDSAVLDGSRGYDVLYRAAGSTVPNYKNLRMSAEFGLGPTGREAVVKYPLLPLAVRCAQD